MQTLRKTNPKPVARVKTILIDPFQGGLIPLAVDPTDLVTLHKLVDCELMASKAMSDSVTLWVDECANHREPAVYPQFTIVDDDANRYQVTGYGLLSGPMRHGRITEFAPQMLLLRALATVIQFEPWQERLDPYSYLDQLFRIY
jgi:hypothetical protein